MSKVLREVAFDEEGAGIGFGGIGSNSWTIWIVVIFIIFFFAGPGFGFGENCCCDPCRRRSCKSSRSSRSCSRSKSFKRRTSKRFFPPLIFPRCPFGFRRFSGGNTNIINVNADDGE